MPVRAGLNMAQDKNILIGSPGVGGESHNIRIGNPAVHTSCTVAGIYGASLTTTNAPVYINSDGKMGTVGNTLGLFGSLSFFYYVPTTITNVTGLSRYWIGAGNGSVAKPLSMLYDNTSGAFNPGSGTANSEANGAYFQAPADGIYFMQFALNLDIGNPATVLDSNAAITIKTPTGSYQSLYAATSGSQGFFIGNQLLLVAPAVDLASGQKAKFALQVLRQDNLDVDGVSGLSNPYISYICGYRVA